MLYSNGLKSIAKVMNLDKITDEIIDTSIQIHSDLGPGLLESVYEAVLALLLRNKGLLVETQLTIDFEYQGIMFALCLKKVLGAI